MNLTVALYVADTALIQLSQSDLSQLVLGMKQTNNWLNKNKVSLKFDKTFLISFQKGWKQKQSNINREKSDLKRKIGEASWNLD